MRAHTRQYLTFGYLQKYFALTFQCSALIEGTSNECSVKTSCYLVIRGQDSFIHVQRSFYILRCLNLFMLHENQFMCPLKARGHVGWSVLPMLFVYHDAYTD